MIDVKAIENLANLSRIELDEEEKDKISKDLDSIIGYVSELKTVSTDTVANDSSDDIFDSENKPINILREDGGEHDKSLYSDQILASAPKVENDYIVVKRILDNIK